jgi:uncharacterized protein (DUF1778 family)
MFLFYKFYMVKKQMGRPPKDPADQQSEIVAVRMTQDERAQCQHAADRAGVKLSAWMRDRLLRAAKRESKTD